MKQHTCKESKTCSCSVIGLEPDEECPVHGYGEYPPRCEICGRFIKRTEYIFEDIARNPSQFLKNFQ